MKSMIKILTNQGRNRTWSETSVNIYFRVWIIIKKIVWLFHFLFTIK